MGIFKSKPQSTYDNMTPSSTGKGTVGGLIFCNATNDVLVWKYPYMDIKKGAVIKVHENQMAVLFDSGKLAAVLEPGREVVANSNNIPYLGKMLNIATGGETSYPLELWFVNMTVEHNINWGFGESSGCKVEDPAIPGAMYSVTGFGSYRFRICDPVAFLKKLVGTQHLSTEKDILAFFKDESIATITGFIQQAASELNLSPGKLGGARIRVQSLIKDYFNESWKTQYGTEITALSCAGLDSPEYNKYLASVQKRAGFEAEGRYYDSERQYDIAKTAVNNLGSGNTMDATMGVGMGLTMGAGIGQMIGGMMNGISQPHNNAATPSSPQPMAPPPLPPQNVYHIAINGQATGPFPVSDIARMVSEGTVSRQSLVWCPLMAGWAEASTVKELAGLFPPPVPGF